jgi:hypothetical protein
MNPREAETSLPIRYALRRLLGWRPAEGWSRAERSAPSAAPTAQPPRSHGGTAGTVGPREGPFIFRAEHLDSAAAFTASMKGSLVEVCVNSAHPAFPLLAPSLRDEELLPERSALRAENARLRQAVRILLAGWVLYEHDLQGTQRQRAEAVRYDWGRGIRRLLLRE